MQAYQRPQPQFERAVRRALGDGVGRYAKGYIGTLIQLGYLLPSSKSTADRLTSHESAFGNSMRSSDGTRNGAEHPLRKAIVCIPGHLLQL